MRQFYDKFEVERHNNPQSIPVKNNINSKSYITADLLDVMKNALLRLNAHIYQTVILQKLLKFYGISKAEPGLSNKDVDLCLFLQC